MDGGVQRLIQGVALAVALGACGGDGEQAGPVAPRTPSTTTTSSVVDATTTTTTAAAATSTTRRRARPLPGPVTPSTPLAGKVPQWHADLAAGTTASCTRLVQDTTATPAEQDINAVLVLLYRGAGEGCLRRTAQARRTLDRARMVLNDLSPIQLGLATPPCGPQELLSWAFFTYLGTEIPTTCPPAPTTASSSSSTTRTSLSPTTTRRR